VEVHVAGRHVGHHVVHDSRCTPLCGRPSSHDSHASDGPITPRGTSEDAAPGVSRRPGVAHRP
jgi:hypothetical protein